jgi:hypothetical protein
VTRFLTVRPSLAHSLLSWCLTISLVLVFRSGTVVRTPARLRSAPQIVIHIHIRPSSRLPALPLSLSSVTTLCGLLKLSPVQVQTPYEPELNLKFGSFRFRFRVHGNL